MLKPTRDQMLDNVSVGVLLVAADYRVHFWNRWMEEKTGIMADRALGQHLKKLFPDLKSPRFDMALEFVIQYQIAQVLSQALNASVIPIPAQRRASADLPLMQQELSLAPIQNEDGSIWALINITDVTDKIFRLNHIKNTLQRMETESTKDALTNCYNRRFMWDWLEHEFRLAHRYQYSISCLLIDIDYFKQINDQYGHDAGDDVLKDLSDKLRALLRKSDILVRYGGEEFLIVLPKCDLETAIVLAEKIRQYVETHSVEQGAIKGHKFTCSIGIAERKPTDSLSVDELLKLADTRLYKAKDKGRNCVYAV